MDRCIVLNGDFTFLNTVSWRRAISLVMTGKSEVVKYTNRFIRCSDGRKIAIPVVIKLIKVIRMIYKNCVPYTKKNVMCRDNYKCVYCGSTKELLTIDHIIPISRGGETSFENCVTSCRVCNSKKKDRTPSEAKMFMSKIPHAPTISEFFQMKMRQLGVDNFLKELGVY